MSDKRLGPLMQVALDLDIPADRLGKVAELAEPFLAAVIVDTLDETDLSAWRKLLDSKKAALCAPAAETPPTTPAAIPEEVQKLSPAEKANWARQHQTRAAGGAAAEGSDASPRRQQRVLPPPPAEKVQEWSTLPPTERMSRYRAWAAEQTTAPA